MTSINFNQVLQENSTFPDYASVDDPRRMSLHRSLLQSITHYKEIKRLNDKLQNKVLTFFQNRYEFQDKEVFDRIWNELKADVWTPKDILTAGTIRAIDNKFRQGLIYHGEGIHAPDIKLNIDNNVQKLMQALLHGGQFSFDFIEKNTVKAILVAHDPALMKQCQQILQSNLDNLAENLPTDSQREIVWRAFLGNILALLPYSYPSSGDKFTIPILQNGACRKVVYQTEVIPLLYNKHTSPMTALGFTPVKDAKAPSILSFIGTTFPAGSGFIATLLADTTPGHSVGEIIYKRNRKAIDEWLADKKNTHVVGMSLGGAMALHTLRHHHEIARMDAYCPPGLSSKNWKLGVGSTCDVNIYCQPGDFVSKLGKWPTGDNVSLYFTYPHQTGVGEDPISAHARAFTGCDQITMIKKDPMEENKSAERFMFTKVNQILGPVVVFLPVSSSLLAYRMALSVQKAGLYCLDKFGLVKEH